ncbi:trigger factor [Niveispirillum cyanobacteriorum]|uniref:Trigger factor n=1 Tax=Niveispirillum cyanobacteriorum TaxID=1612173 RepID=A0A2K9NIM1_9PROT|nr:trigger factor [Niveispirillum cyanobacteriorum]AUN32145.1 trigger factor [Niveispirillum cyanobacteriorum]GGE74675.1 trigger factor [Niveispirillum cyanobacteriorum]
MQITETSAEGLRRDFKVVITAQDIESRVQTRLTEVGKTVKIPGFRPGKVPMPILKQRYGQSVMGEVLEAAVNDGAQKAVSDNNLRPALQPKIEVLKFDPGQDLEFAVQVELLPEIEPADLSAVEIEKPVAAVADDTVTEALGRLSKGRRTTEKVEEDRAAVTGDILLIDFDGSVDGEKRPGMKGDDYELELGSGSFIPGFEDQLVGTKAGSDVSVNVSFPAEYHAAELAGKAAVFEVKVKEIRVGKDAELNDDLAKTFGFDDLEALKAAIKERTEGEYGQTSRLRAKRALLDKLAELHSFEVPAGMVEIEFEQIWKRLQEELARGGADAEDEGKSEDDLKAEYRDIAVRRVRLGLLLSEIGRRNNITVSREELQKAMFDEVRRYPGQEQQVFEFFQKNPQAVESLRAPIYEDKVVDFILGTVKVNEVTVSVEELMRDPDEDEVAAA